MASSASSSRIWLPASSATPSNNPFGVLFTHPELGSRIFVGSVAWLLYDFVYYGTSFNQVRPQRRHRIHAPLLLLGACGPRMASPHARASRHPVQRPPLSQTPVRPTPPSDTSLT